MAFLTHADATGAQFTASNITGLTFDDLICPDGVVAAPPRPLSPWLLRSVWKWRDLRRFGIDRAPT